MEEYETCLPFAFPWLWAEHNCPFKTQIAAIDMINVKVWTYSDKSARVQLPPQCYTRCADSCLGRFQQIWLCKTLGINYMSVLKKPQAHNSEECILKFMARIYLNFGVLETQYVWLLCFFAALYYCNISSPCLPPLLSEVADFPNR